MWPVNEFTISMLVLCMEFTFSSYNQKKYFLGSDVTQKCSCSKEAESSCSVIYPMKNSNAKEFHYEGSLFVLISNVCEKNNGKYICIKNDLTDSATTFAVKEWNTKEEFTMYRAIGDDLILLCKTQKTVTHISWQWTSSDTVTKDTIHVNFTDNSTNVGKLYNHLNCLYGVKLPVNFNASGQYKCIFPDNSIGVTINLVTVEVNAYPSSSVSRNSNVSITCTVSHVISNLHDVLLVLAKVNGNTSVAVKEHNITSLSRQLTLNIIIVNEYSIKWACLVFNDTQLVALAPLTLKYVIDSTTTTQGVDASETDEDPVHFKTHKTYIYISAMAVVVIIIGSLHMLRRSGGKTEEIQTLSSKIEEMQYTSLSFNMQSEGDDERSLTPSYIPACRPKDHEVLYAQVQLNT